MPSSTPPPFLQTDQYRNGEVRSNDKIIIRPYESNDYEVCREIFAEGMLQLVTPLMENDFKRFLKIAVFLAIFLAAAAFQWSVWIIVGYFIVCIVLTALLYMFVYLEVMKFVSSCLNTDLKDIDKAYMNNKGSCMFVAEYSGKVVGLVGLIHTEKHDEGVVELQRMSVSATVRRKGVAGKLVRELIQFAKEQHHKKIILGTSSAQQPAIALYKKCGFRLVNVIPFPSTFMEGVSVNLFELKV